MKFVCMSLAVCAMLGIATARADVAIGFEEYAQGTSLTEENCAALVASLDENTELMINGVTGFYSGYYDNVAGIPTPFASAGTNCLAIKTRFGYPCAFGLKEDKSSVPVSLEHPYLIDFLAKFTVLDDTPGSVAEFSMQSASLLQAMSLSGSTSFDGTGKVSTISFEETQPRGLIVVARKGFVCYVDDDIMLWKQEIEDEKTYNLSTNWWIRAGNGSGGTTDYVLTSAGDGPLPTGDEDWHRVTFKVFMSEDASSLLLNVFIDGKQVRSGETEAFPSMTARTSVTTVRFDGTGNVDNISAQGLTEELPQVEEPPQRDGSVLVSGGEVQYFGAEDARWVNGNELLLKFTREGSFVLPGQTKARILAVGGGGGGGGIRSASAAMVAPYGAGAGGGAGGLVELSNVFPPATYAVTVGAGGAGGASATTHSSPFYQGKSGGDTAITTNGQEFVTAKGGGGGGGENVGLDGGSGGGGSQYRRASGASGGDVRAGGSGTAGQGYAGGAGDISLYGGGGGGAGGAGAAASTLSPVGGDGLPCDITGETLYYAGGGGGGFSDKSFTGLHDPIAGGKGGGGNGGYGLNVPCTDATFYGGGGGGCGALPTSSTLPGGSGYQGVVYVRIIVIAVDEIVKPTNQAVAFDGLEHVLVPANAAYRIVDLTAGSATYGQVVEKMAGTRSGTYRAKVTLIDGFKWSDGSDDEVTVTLAISKATPAISNLSIRDWIEGTPLEATPNPGCDVSIAVMPAYFYGESSTGPWNAGKPTVAGDYYLRAYIASTDSCNEAEAIASFKILKGPGDLFRDCVDIAIDGVSPAKTDFVYELKLGEGSPVGFLYSRAGNTGEELAITDADGNLLDYRVDCWDTAGESTLLVKLPTLSTTGQKIRLFWYPRDGKIVPEHSGEVGDPGGVTQPDCAFDLVVRDGKRVNYWLAEPSLTKTRWDSTSEEPGMVASTGMLKESITSLLYVTNLNTGAISDEIVNVGGSYSAVFGPHDPSGDYEPMEFPVDYFVIGHPSYSDLSGEFYGEEAALTRNGRVLLANDDSAPGGYAVAGQSYWQTDGEKYSTYWEHSEEHYVQSYQFPYLMPYSCHVLYAKNSDGGSDVLWTLEDIILGSTYGNDLTPLSYQCYLPNSPTAKAISSESAVPGLAEQGTMVMRNIVGAVIVSPQYTNGIGTIYFDVVNADTRYADSGYYKIQVEVSVDGGLNYAPYPMKPFKRDGTAAFVADQTDTTELTLEIANGGTADNFYRVAVPVDKSGNVRFRIVRTARVPSSVWDDDYGGFILLDNILVSYQKSTAELEPYGAYDHWCTGRQVVGWGGAMSVPFPAVGDTVYARAKMVVNTNANARVAVDMPITWAQMHYRWRYLDQQAGEWKVVGLRPNDGFISTRPLDLPAKEGDVEFWYEYIAQVPSYKYHDYSGLGLGFADADGNALYSEETLLCTNRQASAYGYAGLHSGGTDWFFRLRSGESEWESFTLYAKEGEGGEVRAYDMSLVGDHTWRGLCPMRTALAGGLYVRIAGHNRQTPGGEGYDMVFARYSLARSASGLPAADMLSERPDDDSWAWFSVPCDANSGQLMFQVRDDTLAYTVVHAEYQSFNGWTDANKKDGMGLFVGMGKAAGSGSMAYATSDSETSSSNFEAWNETVATNAIWEESFLATRAELDYGAWPLYHPFSSTVSPNGSFTVGPGQWVNGYYRDNNTGMALQMEGKGKGYIQFVNSDVSPRGLESVSFRARVAQSISFNDFAYYMGGVAMTNYTFMTAAAFDVNGRRDFAGNASLSLVALYTPGVGCYELRVEQENATVSAAGIVSPGMTFRISLYRWAYDDETEEIVATLLGTSMHSNGSYMFNTTSEGGNYGRLFISVDTSVDGETRVVGGVARTSVNRSAFFGSASYREVMIRDKAENRLVRGTYGLLSANCPAHFLLPAYSATPVTYQVPTKTGFQYGTWSLAPLAYRVECRTDIGGGMWAVKKGRMVAVNTGDSSRYGISAVVPETTVNVYTAPRGTADWKLLAAVPVAGFGSSASAGATTTIPVYSLKECSVNISTGSGKNVDVTIDDIEFRQWRAESYDEGNQYGVFDRTLYGSPTNIVFTQGWVSRDDDSSGNPRKTCLLSAKRSCQDVASSIRSPRMVDEHADKGLGLGSLAFTYENAQSNAVLLVQIATNNVVLSGFADLTKSVSEAEWTTVTNIDFSAMTAEERSSGTMRFYFGLREVKGAMRIAVDPKVVKAVENVMDPTAFGEVTITGVSFRDEPELDDFSWWGWNMRTTDDPAMRSLADNTARGMDVGLSFGLNNSVTEDIRIDEPAEQFAKKSPFLQTPTFTTNFMGEVSFMARLYDTNDAAARVTLYGARGGDVSDEALWMKLMSWDVTNTTFETYSWKLAPDIQCTAFRLAVTGVEGVSDPMPDDSPLVPARRVLLDEVLLAEACDAGSRDPIPEVAVDAVPESVTNAIEAAGFADVAAVKAAIGGSAAEYGKFKAWAGGVKGSGSASGTLAGEAAVVANTNAAAAYLLGAERLFENAPKVELALESGIWSLGSGDGMALPISVTVLDGEEAVKCAAEKVKDMFEATSDLGDWNGAAKLPPEVSVEAGEGATMRFKVTAGDGTATRAFLRIRK